MTQRPEDEAPTGARRLENGELLPAEEEGAAVASQDSDQLAELEDLSADLDDKNRELEPNKLVRGIEETSKRFSKYSTEILYGILGGIAGAVGGVQIGVVAGGALALTGPVGAAAGIVRIIAFRGPRWIRAEREGSILAGEQRNALALLRDLDKDAPEDLKEGYYDMIRNAQRQYRRRIGDGTPVDPPSAGDNTQLPGS